MKSDIEIARSIELTKIKQVAANFGMPLEYVTHYGRYMAKVSEEIIDEEKVKTVTLFWLQPSPLQRQVSVRLQCQ